MEHAGLGKIDKTESETPYGWMDGQAAATSFAGVDGLLFDAYVVVVGEGGAHLPRQNF